MNSIAAKKATRNALIFVLISVVALLLTFVIGRFMDQGLCRPILGSSKSQVLELCGKPDATYSVSDPYLPQEEWDYTTTVVGFIGGDVTYVLTMDE